MRRGRTKNCRIEFVLTKWGKVNKTNLKKNFEKREKYKKEKRDRAEKGEEGGLKEHEIKREKPEEVWFANKWSSLPESQREKKQRKNA